jgi:Protein of unknown function (DUF1573)
MFRFSLAVISGLCLGMPALAGSGADGMFQELSKDFGTVARGPELSFPFRFTNNTGQTVHVASVRVSCGCTTAQALQTDVEPGKTGVILASMDTRRFLGAKRVTIFVQFDRPQWSESRLWVQANSRDDLSISPDGLAFGQTSQGSHPVQTVTVTFYGNGQRTIEESRGDSAYIQTAVKELQRNPTEVSYQVRASIRPDTPAGKWFSDVWLKTNDPSMPRIRIPLTVDVEPVATAQAKAAKPKL